MIALLEPAPIPRKKKEKMKSEEKRKRTHKKCAIQHTFANIILKMVIQYVAKMIPKLISPRPRHVNIRLLVTCIILLFANPWLSVFLPNVCVSSVLVASVMNSK